MPWQKFEALYEAHSKRIAVEGVVLVRNAQISGAWANSNFDASKEGEESPRSKLLENIYDNYTKSVKMIYNQYDEKDDSGIDWDDPFFKAMKVPSNPHYKPNETSPVPHDHNLEDIEIDQG
jgi:hypothetical protein